MHHDSEKWGSNNPELQLLHHNDHVMICWNCGTKDRQNTIVFTTTETWHWGCYVGSFLSATVIMAWLVLIDKTVMQGETILNIAWYCQPHRIVHRQHFNLKMDMGGWSPISCSTTIWIIIWTRTIWKQRNLRNFFSHKFKFIDIHSNSWQYNKILYIEWDLHVVPSMVKHNQFLISISESSKLQ